jgi:opacity protein-like surface antigen
MFKFALVVIGLVVFCPIIASAQEVPEYEVFAGYSYLRGKGAAIPSRSDENLDMHGWNVSVARNFTDWFALVGDFSGHYGAHHFRVSTPIGRFSSDTSKNIHLFLGGPRFSLFKSRRFSPYVQSLIGVVRASTSSEDRFESSAPFKVSNTDIGFAAAFGVGLDARLTEKLALRLVQADYVLTRLDGSNGLPENKENLRVSGGLCFRFGP